MSSIFRHVSPRASEDLLIAGTNTSAGKNFLMCGILRAAKNNGAPVKPFKPLELDVGDGNETLLSPGMYQKARSAKVPLVGAMCPFWIVYYEGASNLFLCGERKGCVAHDGSDNDPAFVRNEVIAAIQSLKGDGSRLVIEAPGAFSESHDSVQVKSVLDTLDPDILLVGDFLRGGGLALLIGTLELLPLSVRRRIVGVVLNHIDEVHGSSYPAFCSEQLFERFGIPIVGMLPTYREGYHMISEENKVMPDDLFDLQVERLAVELGARLHPSVMAHI